MKNYNLDKPISYSLDSLFQKVINLQEEHYSVEEMLLLNTKKLYEHPVESLVLTCLNKREFISHIANKVIENFTPEQSAMSMMFWNMDKKDPDFAKAFNKMIHQEHDLEYQVENGFQPKDVLAFVFLDKATELVNSLKDFRNLEPNQPIEDGILYQFEQFVNDSLNTLQIEKAVDFINESISFEEEELER